MRRQFGIEEKALNGAGVNLMRTVSAIVTLAMLSGCSLIGGGSAPLDTYVLSVPTSEVQQTRRAKTQILVTEPKALKLFDTQNIAVRTSPTSVEYLGGAQWGDLLPRTVQSALAEALQNAGFAGGVGVPGQGLAIDYQIISEIRDFSVATDGNDRANVEIYVQMLNDRTGNVIARKVFTASANVSGPENFVEGLNSAFGVVARDIVSWTASQI